MDNILKYKITPEELNEIVDNILQQAMIYNRAKAGTLQLFNKEKNSLDLMASFGLSDDFIEYFKTVDINDSSVCARALKIRKTIFIDDLSKDKLFMPHLAVALRNGIFAVQSTPLISGKRNIIGMVSTHFKLPRKPTADEMRNFENFCRQAADTLEEIL